MSSTSGSRSRSRSLGRSPRSGAVGAFAALALFGSVGLAQNPVAGGEDGPHPAHIHAGTCDELGDVVFPLEDVAIQEGERSGAESALPIKTGYTLVDAPLEEIVAGGHAINVHLSGEEIEEYIACGDIGGVVTTDDEEGTDELTIALSELNGSGHVGVAWLGALGDQTEVSVTLIEPGEME